MGLLRGWYGLHKSTGSPDSDMVVFTDIHRGISTYRLEYRSTFDYHLWPNARRPRGIQLKDMARCRDAGRPEGHIISLLNSLSTFAKAHQL